MKKLLKLIFVISIILVGCASTIDNQIASREVYQAQFNLFEEQDWISITKVELFQDNNYIYFYVSYISEFNGKFSVFNPPNGDSIKKLGRITDGEGTFLQGIEKGLLNSIEGITVLLFQDDFSNDGSRAGFFINSQEIQSNQIGFIPEGMAKEVEQLNKMEQQATAQSNSNTSADNLNANESSKDHGVTNTVSNADIALLDEDFEFRELIRMNIPNINLTKDQEADIIGFFGEPAEKTWFNNGTQKTFSYSDQFNIVFNVQSGDIFELRLHNPGYKTEMGIGVGSSLLDVTAVYGEPEEIQTISNWNIDSRAGILYKMRSESYYLLQDLTLRFFFDQNDLVSGMYILSPYFTME